MIPDDQNTLTYQSANRNNSPWDCLVGPVTYGFLVLTWNLINLPLKLNQCIVLIAYHQTHTNKAPMMLSFFHLITPCNPLLKKYGRKVPVQDTSSLLIFGILPYIQNRVGIVTKLINKTRSENINMFEVFIINYFIHWFTIWFTGSTRLFLIFEIIIFVF